MYVGVSSDTSNHKLDIIDKYESNSPNKIIQKCFL